MALLGAPPSPLGFEPFGLLVGCAVVFGTIVGMRRLHQVGLDARLAYHLALWAFVPGMITAHLYSAIFYFPEKIAADPLYLLYVWEDLSSFGGFIGGALGPLYFFHRHRIPVWPYADGIAYGFAFGWIFGRLGCTLVFDHPGVTTDFVLGMSYPRALGGEPAGVLRHNLGLYEMMWQPVVFGAMFIQRMRSRVSGYYVALAVLVYTPVRFGLDFLRAADRTYLGLTAGQYAAIALFGVGIWLYRWRRSVGEQVVADGRIHVFPDGTKAIPDASTDELPPFRWIPTAR